MRMLRVAFFVFINEFRLLARDRVGIFMMILAPMVIIAVAGFSLSSIYGSQSTAEPYAIPVVDQDHGEVARAVISGLRNTHLIDVLPVSNVAQARAIVAGRSRAAIAIVIPAGTTKALENGHTAHLELYTDPVKQLEANLLALRLNELSRQITARAQAHARRAIAADAAEDRARLEHLVDGVKRVAAAIDSYRSELVRGRIQETAMLHARIHRALAVLDDRMQAQIDQLIAQRSAFAAEMASRQNALLAVKRYMAALHTSEQAFDRWFGELKAMAGAHRVDIPPPPAFPSPPPAEQLAELSKPPEPPQLQIEVPHPPEISLRLPEPPPFPTLDLPQDRNMSMSDAVPVLPGDLAWTERSLGGGPPQTNAFDQYVPGFGITFLFIAMLLAIGLGLIDERDWGTLRRLQVCGAPLAGVVIGKLLSRSLVGLCQMIVLFAVGWWLFDVSLGRNPLMLLVPTAAIAFAAASISLVTACIARTHDSVMPVGATIAMAMSAIGGCWWPLDFEPSWMRAVAQWLPTTWTMRAYNDLMIRHFQPDVALWAAAVTAGLGLLYLAIGMLAAVKIYD